MQTAKKFYPNVQVTRVYPGILVELFDVSPNPELRSQLGFQIENVVIGIFARFQQGKGVHVFIEAAALVYQHCPTARFIIVGDTLFGMDVNYKQELISRIKELKMEDNIKMLGFRQDVPELMRATDIVVSSSVLPEGFGVTLVEAMLSGKVVIATAHGGPTEIIIDNETGFLVAPKDSNALANKLLDVIANPSLQKKIGERARESAFSRFNVETMLDELQQIYSSININS